MDRSAASRRNGADVAALHRLSVRDRRLQLLVGGQDVLVPAGGKDGRDGRFADIAAMTLAVITDQCPEGADAIDLHDIEQVLAAVREVLTDVLADFHAAFFQFAVHHVFQQCRAATTAGAGLGFCLNTSKVGTAGIDHAADIALGHVVAGADRGGFRQGIRAQRGSTALVFRQNQGLRVLRQLSSSWLTALSGQDH